ncbi:SDR family oxidoreductase, partial [Escherichia coli]
ASHPAGDNLHFVQCDLACPQSVSALGEQIERQAGKIDLLVNNAGIVKVSLFASMSYVDFTQDIETNMFSMFRRTKDALM